MAEASGYASKTAVKRPAETSEYGTEATSITNQIPLKSSSMGLKPNYAESEAVVGEASIIDMDLISLDTPGSISTELWFEGLEYLLFASMGFESPDEPSLRTTGDFDTGGSPAPNDGTPNSFLHIFEQDTNLHREVWLAGERDASGAGDYVWTGADQKVRTVSHCEEKNVGDPSILHFVDCMVNKFSVKGSVSGIEAAFDLIPRSGSFAGASTNWELPSYGPPRQATWPMVKFYLTALADTLATELPISEFELVVENNLKADDYDTGGNDASDGLSYITEPKRNGPRKTTLKAKTTRYNATNAAVEAQLAAGTEVQAMIAITGPDISGSAYPYQYVFAMPRLKITKAAFPIAGPGVIQGDLEFTALKPTSTSYGYSWVEAVFGGIYRRKMQELVIGLTNTRGSCFSRDRNTAYPLP